ncbi:MAG: acyltransferase family protein [Lachnospiraceae bacterium]|nr:acyltransferase family protein [Lachnospiraceae bacterium]
MAELRSKSNKKFMILSAIGIFMVVDHHTFTALNLFGDLIPYNSFFMPMFVFISGYFNRVNKDTRLLPYFGKKLRTLLLPYAGLTLIILVLQQLMNLFKLGVFEGIPSWYPAYMLERVVTVGSPLVIATPMWFVISLFSTLSVYAIIKKVLGRIWNSYVMFGIFCILHAAVVYLTKTVDPESFYRFLVPLKVLFFLPFLEMGIIYRDHIEKRHDALSGGWKLGLMAVLLVFNMIRTMYLPAAYDIAFDSLDDLSGFTSPFIVTPLISSLVGILFWLTLADLIGKPLYESRFVNYLSCNTFWIMGLHITFFNILNCILMLVNNFIELPYFDVETFRESEWYYWELSPSFKLAYVLVGILGPLGLKRLSDHITGKA